MAVTDLVVFPLIQVIVTFLGREDTGACEDCEGVGVAEALELGDGVAAGAGVGAGGGASWLSFT